MSRSASGAFGSPEKDEFYVALKKMSFTMPNPKPILKMLIVCSASALLCNVATPTVTPALADEILSNLAKDMLHRQKKSAPAKKADNAQDDAKEPELRDFAGAVLIDDHGTDNTIGFPQITYWPNIDGGQRETDVAISVQKQITEGFAVTISSGYGLHTPGASGWSGVTTGIKYNFLKNVADELAVTGGLYIDWAKSGTGDFLTTYSNVRPTLNIAKGFKTLSSNPYIQSIAVIGSFGLTVPTASSITTDTTTPNPTYFNWGASFQYSLPYLADKTGEISRTQTLSHVTPIAEVAMQTPIANYDSSSNKTKGIVGLGFAYKPKDWEASIMYMVPVNSNYGSTPGLMAKLNIPF
jgi:hypothetical protein